LRDGVKFFLSAPIFSCSGGYDLLKRTSHGPPPRIYNKFTLFRGSHALNLNQGGHYAYSKETGQESSGKARSQESCGKEASRKGEEESPGEKDRGEEEIAQASSTLSAARP
jgi:hypothetical protein